MKRLFLTHFCFTTGPNELEHQLYRLTVLTKEDVENSAGNQPDDVLATAKAVAWFEINYPESKLGSAIAFSAIEKVEKENAFELQQEVKTGLPESDFVRSFGPDEFPPFEDEDQAASVDVLIDLNGDRDNFAIAYYSHIDHEWKNSDSLLGYDWASLVNARWFHLPLAKYDKHKVK